ncbi:tubulin--tyrosine ligase [Linderina macrospora]|uniref:Tubulin--tyrosine ligase n=1 Tax=Linderina macrospora TaxID=4868 RepID=A0ACC1JEU3_9FUNG|nr:tubulin--tyrosine ligase [Linderina macrospora]
MADTLDTAQQPAAVIVEMDEPYVQTILERTFSKYHPLVTTASPTTSVPGKLMHWREYEKIDWDTVHRSTSVFSSAYCIRKGLIRKAQMAFNIKLYVAKHPDSILQRGVPETWIFELDDIDYLDEALMECFEVEDGMCANEGVEEPRDRQQFILKPSLTGRGAGIYVFDTRERLEELLEREFESDNEDSDNEDEMEEGQMISQIREWVIQRYINRPLLLPTHGSRKFHIRVYVLAVGSLQVFVYRQMLALFAPQSYKESAGNLDDQRAHLTNTCLQAQAPGFDESSAVELFWKLDLDKEKKDKVFDQICEILHDTFAAVASEPTSFQAWPNCIEQFGFDFLVDEDCNALMLEANAYPDFKQTGEGLKSVVEGFMAASVATAVEKFLVDEKDITDEMQRMMNADREGLVEVYSRSNDRHR